MTATPAPSPAALPDAARLAHAGLRVEVDGAVAHVTLDRPGRKNSQTPATWYALADVAAALPDEVRVVVVRGAGGTFSAGLDTGMLSGQAVEGEESVLDLLGLDDQQMADRIAEYQQGFLWARDPRFVTIAVVEGWAIGAGFQLALSCDLRVLADDARLCMKESALGLVPDLTGTKPLVELVGYARALEICATARAVSAAEAQAIGLATVVVPTAELDASVADLVGALTAPMAGAVRGTKQILLGAQGRSLAEQAEQERAVQVGRFRELAALLGG